MRDLRSLPASEAIQEPLRMLFNKVFPGFNLFVLIAPTHQVKTNLLRLPRAFMLVFDPNRLTLVIFQNRYVDSLGKGTGTELGPRTNIEQGYIAGEDLLKLVAANCPHVFFTVHPGPGNWSN